jgi:hypothetical protein
LSAFWFQTCYRHEPAAGLLNHITTATCAAEGISSSTEGHPRRPKIPLDFGVSSGPHTFHHGIEICQVFKPIRLEPLLARWIFTRCGIRSPSLI